MDLNVVIEENEEVRGGGGNNFLEIIETEAEAPYLINLDIIEKVRDIYVGRELLQELFIHDQSSQVFIVSK